MNEQNNTPEPKKSFWAKLFGGGKKDAQSQTSTNPVTPTPVLSTDTPSSESSLPETPPESQLSSVDATPTPSSPFDASPLTSPIEAPSPYSSSEETTPLETPTTGSAYGEGTPAGVGSFNEAPSAVATDAFPPASSTVTEEIVTPPSDPMVTPVTQSNSFETPDLTGVDSTSSPVENVTSPEISQSPVLDPLSQPAPFPSSEPTSPDSTPTPGSRE